VKRASALAALALVACHASPPPPEALRALYGLGPPAELASASTALVLVDFQDEFFHGKLPVEDGGVAVERAAALRGWARARGILVVHVRNVARPGSRVFAESSPTIAFVPELAPEGRELVVTKHKAGAFSQTDLDETLRARRVDTLIVAGIMTHLAVDTTARDGAVLGYRVVVASDACATRAIPSPLGGPPIAAAEVHRVALASIADRFADVMPAEAVMRLPVTR